VSPTVNLIIVPYHLGRHKQGMGAGPSTLRERGAVDAVRRVGCEVTVSEVEVAPLPGDEIAATFAVNQRLAALVRDGVAQGAFPLVLAGNCSACLGVLAGLGRREVGIAWFDAHGDMHTPETSTSGFFDGMALNVAVGRSWIPEAHGIPGFAPVSEEHVALLGTRDLDPGEREVLGVSSVKLVECWEIQRDGVAALRRHLEPIARRSGDTYLHIDLDVLSRDLVPANQFSPEGGLEPAELTAAIDVVFGLFAVRGAALTAYDPGADPEGRASSAALAIVEHVARRVASSARTGRPVTG